MSEHDTAEDKGLTLFVVRLALPSQAVIERLPPERRQHLASNLERAVRRFRAGTLPLSGSPARLAVYHELDRLDKEIDDILRTGFNDEAGREALAPDLEEIRLPPGDDFRWIDLIRDYQGRPELQTAADLLGKYWYRRKDEIVRMVESLDLARELQAARDRGESGEALLRRPFDTPLPPRRGPKA